MIRKLVLTTVAFGAVLVAAGAVMYFRNATPIVPAVAATEALQPSQPYVIKIHAQWCPVCMVTKGVWSQIEQAYASRVNLLVFDFTSDATAETSRAEARRLGLEQVFDENDGWTGTILIVDPATRAVAASIHGARDFEVYRTAIDAALAAD